MPEYNQISLEERELIYHWLANGISVSEIARRLKRSKSTISREIKRNKTQGDYLFFQAQCKAQARKRINTNKIPRKSELASFVEGGLRKGWSPEQISGRLRRQKKPFYASPKTIYAYAYADENLRKLLPRYGKTKWRNPPHPADFGGGLVNINKRPYAIKARSSFGHWEGDTVFFEHKTKENITVLVERKSRLTLAIKNNSKEASQVLSGIQKKLENLPKAAKKSITLDQGKEFTMPQFFKQSLGMEAYYCDKGHPWQKGSVENTNGRIRRFLPKITNIEAYTQESIENIIAIMNNTPRKCLGYKTPIEHWKKFINRCTSS